MRDVLDGWHFGGLWQNRRERPENRACERHGLDARVGQQSGVLRGVFAGPQHARRDGPEHDSNLDERNFVDVERDHHQ